MEGINKKRRDAIEGNVREKLISWIIIVIIFITFWYMLNIVLLTFILTFIFYNLLNFIQKQHRRLFKLTFPDGFIITLIYAVFIGLLIIISYEVMPKIIGQIVEIGNLFRLFDMRALESILDDRLYDVVVQMDFNTYIEKAGELLIQGITSISIFGFNLFISILLSFLLLLEKEKICCFGLSLVNSRISFIYLYIMSFGKSFVETFGKVMRVQITIATINAIVSVILLKLMGFPQILGLGIMIFFLGLIPVAGVIISLIPLSIIAFNIGGISKLITVLLMITIIHAIEAYVLNPKLMSNKTQLPICFIFIILLVAEHYMGVWGLLIGVPIFIFLLNVLDVDFSAIKKHKEITSSQE